MRPGDALLLMLAPDPAQGEASLGATGMEETMMSIGSMQGSMSPRGEY